MSILSLRFLAYSSDLSIYNFIYSFPYVNLKHIAYFHVKVFIFSDVLGIYKVGVYCVFFKYTAIDNSIFFKIQSSPTELNTNLPCVKCQCTLNYNSRFT
jgi:hypothetical protein